MKKLMFLFLLFQPTSLFAQDVVIEENPEGEGWIVVESYKDEKIVTNSTGEEVLVRQTERKIFGRIISANKEVPREIWLDLFKEQPKRIVLDTIVNIFHKGEELWLMEYRQQIQYYAFFNKGNRSIDYGSKQLSSERRLSIGTLIIWFIMLLAIITLSHQEVKDVFNHKNSTSTSIIVGCVASITIGALFGGGVFGSWYAFFFHSGLSMILFVIVFRLIIKLKTKRKQKQQLQPV